MYSKLKKLIVSYFYERRLYRFKVVVSSNAARVQERDIYRERDE